MTMGMLWQGTALVTGGGTGIGRACSLALAERGHKVAVNYSRSQQDAEDTAAEIRERGGQAVAVQADVTDDAAVRRMLDTVRDELGPLTVLVNNAGATEQLAMEDLEGATDEVFERLMKINMMAAWYCARAAAPDLMSAAEDGDAVVVNIGSIAASGGRGSSLPYVVSKAALSGLTRALAHALTPVRVNEVAPGLVLTRWWAGEEDKARQLATNALLDRETAPEDVAAAVVGIVASRAMTGQTIKVDGGQSM